MLKRLLRWLFGRGRRPVRVVVRVRSSDDVERLIQANYKAGELVMEW